MRAQLSLAARVTIAIVLGAIGLGVLHSRRGFDRLTRARRTLESGQVDAALTWDPNIGIIQKSGGTVIATTKSLGMITGGVWVGQQALSREKPEVLQAFLRVWRKAQHDYAKDPKKVRQYEAARIGQSAAEFDALIARQTASHPSFEQLTTADFMGAPGKELDSRLMKHLQGIAAFLVSEKRIKEAPSDWKKMFNTTPMLQVIAGEKK